MEMTRHMLNQEAERQLEQLGALIRYVDTFTHETITEIEGVIPNETLIPVLMHRKVLEKADAIFVNIESGTEHAAQGIMRSMFENYVYLAYVLKNDTVNKCKAYHLGWLKSKLSIIQSFEPNTRKAKVTAEYLGYDLMSKLPDNVVTSEINKAKAQINAPWLKTTNKKWMQLETERRKRKIGRPVSWHSLFGHDSFKQVALAVDKEAQYNILYPTYSLETHTVNAMRMLEHRDGKSFLKPLRIYQDPSTLVSMATTFLWEATNLIVVSLFPEKDTVFTVFSLKNMGRNDLISKYMDSLKRNHPETYAEVMKHV